MAMVTIKDIARECSVSANTVSCVVNNKKGEVSAETRERILEAIRRLGYRPNAAARSMVGKRMNTIGIAERYSDSNEFGNHYKNAFLESILFAARRDRWDVLYYSGHPSEEQVGAFPAYLDGRCDGLLCFTGGINQDEADTICKTNLPVVFLGETPYTHNGSVIDVDNEQGGYLATKHLIDLGHTRIAMMEGRSTSGNVERVRGYHRALSEADIRCGNQYLYPTYPWTGEGYQQAMSVFSLPPKQRPTAIFCFNDMIALGVLQAAAEQGISIPDDLSVIGFDDVLPASLSSPPLTTIRQPLRLMGTRAVEILISMVEGKTPRDYRELTTPELVIRNSTTLANP